MPDPSDKPIQDHPGGDPHSQRALTFALIFGNAVFWLWTFFFIADHTNPKGDGFEWVAVMPFSLVFALGVLLPFMRMLKGPKSGFSIAPRVALMLVIGATVANVILYKQISSEFGPVPAITAR